MSINHPPHGTFVLSLDLPTPAARSLAPTSSDAAAQIVRRIRALHVAATWSVSFGANLAQVADLLGIASRLGGSANELAWHADSTWAGADVGRGKFAVALAERASAALDADVDMSTLVLADGCRPVHLDVAAKYGIRSVVGPDAGKRSPQPQALRFGVWSVPATVNVSDASSWWTNQARRAIHEINRATRTGAVCHLHADLSCPQAAAVLDRVLAHVQRCRVEGKLAVETVAQLASRLARPKIAIRPARSILRVA